MEKLISHKQLWNQRYRMADHFAAYDGWLDGFLENFRAGQRLLELAIGSGPNLPVYKAMNPADIYGCDFSEEALKVVKPQAPGINLFLHDITKPFLFKDHFFSIIVADLCLHYFPRVVTQAIINEIFRLLGAGGRLFLRVNMVGDFGSCFKQGFEIEENVFQNDENIKAFFSSQSLCSYFRQWKKLLVEPNDTNKYGSLKHCLMAVFEK